MVELDVPEEIWEWLYSVVDGVGHHVGTESKGPWLLCYEGWSDLCVALVWDPARSDEENEEAAYDHACENSSAVIDEWIEEHEVQFDLAESRHEPTGLYGVTWALFRRKGINP